MRIAITGTSGRVGAALARHLSTRHQIVPLPRSAFDLADAPGMQRTLDSLECDAFFNPAGLTSLEACEDDPALALRLNGAAPGELAAWAAKRGVRFVHFSTDYVFSGLIPGLRSEEEHPDPLSCYGHTKRVGEQMVLAQGGTVVRVSWVFGPEKPAFADQIIARALAGDSLAAVSDKFSLPTHTADLAGWMEQLLAHPVSGIIHACQSGEPASWYDMARVIVDELVRIGRLPRRPEIASTRLDEISTFRAPRPRHTAMAANRLTALLGHPPRDWQVALRAYVRECR